MSDAAVDLLRKRGLQAHKITDGVSDWLLAGLLDEIIAAEATVEMPASGLRHDERSWSNLVTPPRGFGPTVQPVGPKQVVTRPVAGSS